MRNYYPLISALAAIALLLLPVVILIGTSKKSDPVPSEDKTRTASDDELDDLRKQLTSVSSKLRELEATGNAPPEARELSADKASDPRKMPPQGLFPEAGGQQQASAAEASDIQRIENRIDELNKNLASLIEAQQSAAETATRNSILATEKPEKLDVAKSTEPVSSEEETPAPVDPDTMTDEPAAVPEPAEGEVLTDSALDKEAKKNLRGRMAADIEPAPVDAEPPVNLFDVLLQRPIDGMTVNRVEQLYAQTTAPGWPVVLVRSSFDDEEWWAQPISGRRGTQITARVHFGNEGTPRGSAFTMVILLLDGYEEAVRFRTARRFEQLPKGIRRSREFMFVLK